MKIKISGEVREERTTTRGSELEDIMLEVVGGHIT
jgi:hypothetical protein